MRRYFLFTRKLAIKANAAITAAAEINACIQVPGKAHSHPPVKKLSLTLCSMSAPKDGPVNPDRDETTACIIKPFTPKYNTHA
ncbi:MAG TPA: hypothetical protein VFW07_01000 [Parafilimonas sp.]|nr:hypothetical protein [Parafilimonas sp.]